MAKKKLSQAEVEAKLLCETVATAMLDKKAQNVLSLNLSNIDGAISTYFVICNAESTTQVDAIARNVEEHVRKTLGEKPRRVEGTENSLWILIDYVDVMVHIFQTEMRDFYRIEQLWADAITQVHTDEPPVEKKKATVKKAAAKKVATEPKKKTATKSKTVAAKVEKKAVKPTVKKVAATKAKKEESLEKPVAKKVAVKKTGAAKTTTVKKAATAKKTTRKA